MLMLKIIGEFGGHEIRHDTTHWEALGERPRCKITLFNSTLTGSTGECCAQQNLVASLLFSL